jgi:hypothetical protein
MCLLNFSPTRNANKISRLTVYVFRSKFQRTLTSYNLKISASQRMLKAIRYLRAKHTHLLNALEQHYDDANNNNLGWMNSRYHPHHNHQQFLSHNSRLCCDCFWLEECKKMNIIKNASTFKQVGLAYKKFLYIHKISSSNSVIYFSSLLTTCLHVA